MENLFQRSIEAVLDNLAASGAHIASPDFPNYYSCWFVVGSFTAYDKDLVGEHTSAVRFLDWAVMAINRRARVVQWVVDQAQTNEPLRSVDLLHTRYN